MKELNRNKNVWGLGKKDIYMIFDFLHISRSEFEHTLILLYSKFADH